MLRATLTRAAAVAIIATVAALMSSCSDDKPLGVQGPSALGTGNQDDETQYVVRGYVTDDKTGEPIHNAFVDAWWGQRFMGSYYTDYNGHYWIYLGEDADEEHAYVTMYASHEGYSPHYGGFQYGYGWPTYWYNIELFPGFIDPKLKR
jgi:hypothetical protein